MNFKQPDVLVIGAGASGMLCAGTAASYGLSVILYEKNQKVGRKLNITGKGRCNLTNFCSPDVFFKNIPGNPRFLYSSINAFPPERAMLFFEQEGLPLKIERGNRVFPQSDVAYHVTDTLKEYCIRMGVKILNEEIQDLWIEDNILLGVITSHRRYVAGKNVVVATGGLSYPATGSTGDGYHMALQAGHTIIKPFPSLVPLVANDSFCKELQGLSLKNVTLSVEKNTEKGKRKKIFQELGELLFTHYGMSGPLVLSASAHLRDLENTKYEFYIDLKPGLTEEQLNRRIQRDLEENSKKQLCHSLNALLPKRMVPVILRLADINPFLCCSDIKKEHRYSLVSTLKHFPVHVTGTRPIAEAVVTTGGVSTREIDPKTMESRKLSGLYFTGEVIDVDGYTGGYNLQIAWSTGYAAGSAIGKKIVGEEIR